MDVLRLVYTKHFPWSSALCLLFLIYDIFQKLLCLIVDHYYITWNFPNKFLLLSSCFLVDWFATILDHWSYNVTKRLYTHLPLPTATPLLYLILQGSLLCSQRTNPFPKANHRVNILTNSNNKYRTHSHRSSSSLDVWTEWNTGLPLSVLLKSISIILPSFHLAQWGTLLVGSDFTLVSKNMAKFKNDWEKLSIKVGLLKRGGEGELLEPKSMWQSCSRAYKKYSGK